jgi:hypothetical protein
MGLFGLFKKKKGLNDFLDLIIGDAIAREGNVVKGLFYHSDTERKKILNRNGYHFSKTDFRTLMDVINDIQNKYDKNPQTPIQIIIENIINHR